MGNPLLGDLKSQRPAAIHFLLKAASLVVLFLCLDRALGLVLRAGLDRYYGLNEAAVVLCVGHSHTVLGIDRVALEHALGVKVAKFAVEGANTADRAMMIRYYLKRQPRSVRAVVYDVDAHTFTGAGLSSASYQLLYPFMDDPEMRAYIKRSCASRTEYLLRRLLYTPRFNDLTLSLSVRGFLKKWTNLKFGSVNLTRLAHQIQEGRFRRITFDPDNLHEFAQTAAFLRARGPVLFLAYIPTIDVFNQAEPDKYSTCIEMLQRFANTNSDTVFLNYNPDFEHRHELFYDAVHLNGRGQAEVTSRLASDLKAFLEQKSLAGLPNSGPGTN